MELAIKGLEQIRRLSPELTDYLTSILVKEKYWKRQALLEENQICNQIWFIEKGIIGCFYEKSEKDLCSWFMKENDIATSITSFFRQVRSCETILALEDTVTWSITKKELDYIYEHFPEFNYHGRILTTEYYIAAEERMRAFHNQTPKEKYLYLLEHQPEIVQRVKVKDMAKFLGMHKDALSRIRRNL